MIVVGVGEVREAPLSPTGQRPGADVGDPQTATRILHAQDGVEAGVWECAPGGWPVVDRPDTETMVILSGRALLSETGGETVEIGAGDVVVLPRGWTGRWQVLEPLRKLFIVA